jgi:murein hydrolase activator
LRQYESEERAIGTELEDVEKELGEVKARAIARGRGYYKLVRAGLLPAGSGFEQFVDHAAQVERSRLAIHRDLAREGELGKRRHDLSERLAQLRTQRAPLEVHREAMTRARSVMVEAEERRMAFDRAFDATSTPDHVAVYGADRGPNDLASTQGFKSLFGRLPFPVVGRAEVKRLSLDTTNRPALELRAPAGAVARSVAAGRVAFADRYDSDLITVILDHGDKFFSVYGNLSKADVKVGEEIKGSTSLGEIALRRHEGAVLYFELREQGRAVDPAPWLGL